MAVQRSVPARNAMLDALETAIGSAPRLQLRTGAPPADCAAADAGALVAELTLPADWAPAAANGTKTWAAITPVTAVASGIIGHYRIKNSTGTTTHEQGTAGLAADSPDAVLDNNDVKSGQQVSVTSWTLTAPGA